MKIKTIIKHRKEKIECLAVFEEDTTPFYLFFEDKNVRDNIDDLNVSESFKDALRATDIIETIRDTIPSTKQYINGLCFM